MNLNKKSRPVSLILTILFGPIGLLYSSVVGGILLTIAALAFYWTIIIPVACWIFAIAWGDHAAHRHNRSVDRFERLMMRGRREHGSCRT